MNDADYDSFLPFGGELGEAAGRTLGAGLGAALGAGGGVLAAGLGAALGEAAGGMLAGRAGDGATDAPTGLPTAGMPGMVGDMLGTRGAEGTLGVRIVGELSAPWAAGGLLPGARGAWLGGLDGELNDLRATAVAALGGGGVDPAGGGTDLPGAAGACDAAAGARGATDEPPGGDAAGAGATAFGATLVVAGTGEMLTVRGAGIDPVGAA